MVVKGSKASKLFSGFNVEHLLNAISTFLNSDGGLKSEDDCVKFSNCMKQLGGSMQTICTFLNVINATQEEAVLSKLLSCGAWDTLHSWLSEFKELDESPVLVLLLETFQRLPVTMEMLKSNTTAKIIKALRKHSDEGVKSKAGETVDKWMQLIKSKASNNTDVSSSHPSSTPKNGEHRDKERRKKRHKHSSDDKSEETKPVVSPPKEEMDVDRDVPSPPPPSIFKDSSKSTGSDKSDKSTAKQHNVKERSAGVEAGLIKPKPRGSKPPKTSINPSKPMAASALSSHKRVNIELPGLSELGATPGSKKPKIDPDKEEDFGKAKLIAPLPKPAHIVQDSGGFMEALMQPRPPLVMKKKKSNSNNKAPTSPTEKTSPPNTPLSPVSAPPSFYKDTFEGPSGVSPPHPPSVDSSDRLSPVESTVSSLSVTDENKTESMDTSTSKNTKKVSWKPDKQLRLYHYFELLEDERVNVNRLRDQGGFDEMKKREMMSDRAVLKGLHTEESKSLKHSNAPAAVTEMFTWKRPELIDLPAQKFQPGYLSKERGVQTDREVKVLAAIYFSKAAVPASATEPDHSLDMEASGIESALSIPLEVSSVDGIANDYQPEVHQPVASEPKPRVALLEAPPDNAQSVSDLVPGVTANDMNLIQRLANGEGGQEILEALANTTPDYLNQIMQTEGISPLEGNSAMEIGNGPVPGSAPSLLGDHPPGMSPNFNRPMMNSGPNRGGFRGNYNRGRGGNRPPFNRGGFRGGGAGGQWNGRGRGGFRGRGRGECFRFERNGKCEFGDKCLYLHTPR